MTKILRDTRMPVRPSPAPVRSFKLNVKAVGTKISCDDSYPGLVLVVVLLLCPVLGIGIPSLVQYKNMSLSEGGN